MVVQIKTTNNKSMPNYITAKINDRRENISGLLDRRREHILSQQDFLVSYELLEEIRLKQNCLVANSNPMSDDEIETILEQVRGNEHEMEVINYEQPLAQDDHHLERESLNTTFLPKNPAAIIESNETFDNSVAGLEDKHVLSQQDLSMPYEPLEDNFYLGANFNREDETETIQEQDFCSVHMTLSDAINNELALAQYDHRLETESGHTAYGMLTRFEGHQGGLSNASESDKKRGCSSRCGTSSSDGYNGGETCLIQGIIRAKLVPPLLERNLFRVQPCHGLGTPLQFKIRILISCGMFEVCT